MLKIYKNGKEIELSQANTKIMCVKGDKYLIIDEGTKISPKNIKYKKIKKDLYLYDESTDEVVATFDGYFNQEDIKIYGVFENSAGQSGLELSSMSESSTETLGAEYIFDESSSMLIISNTVATLPIQILPFMLISSAILMDTNHNNDNNVVTNTKTTQEIALDKIKNFDPNNPPSQQDYADAGIDIGTAKTDAESFNLLTDIIKETNPTFTDVKVQIEHIAGIVDKIMDIANGGTADLTVQDLTDIGLSDADLAAKLTTLKNAIDATDDDGTGVDTQTELQNLIDGITNVSGSVTLGPVIENNSLSIEAYTSTGELFGTAKVNSDGTFSFLSYKEYSGTLLLKVVDNNDDADYLDESTGAEKDLTSDIRAVTVLSGFGDYSVNITPLTELATIKMGVTDTTPPTNTTAVDATNKAVAKLFGVEDIINTQPVAINDTNFSTAEASSKQYGEILAALSGMDQDNGGNVGDTLAILNDAITSSVADLSTVQSTEDVSFAWKLDLSGTQGQDALSSGAANANVASAILSKILKADISINADGKTVISGLTAAGINVDVTFPDGTKQSTISRTDGTFEIISDNVQPEGEVIIESFDENGNPLVTSKGVVDENTTSNDTTGPVNPTTNLEVNTDGKLVISGTTEAGAKITVALPDGTTQTTTADRDGNYDLISNTTQPFGDVKVTATDASGNSSPEVTSTFNSSTTSSDTTSPLAPEIVVKTASDGKVIVQGKAEAGSTVEVTFPDNTTKTVVADKDGNFEILSDTAQGDGTITVTATDPSGNESDPAAKTYQISITDIVATIDEDGNVIITGKAPTGEILEVTFPDGTKGEVTADENGDFTIKSDTPQPEGEFIVDDGTSPVKGKIDGDIESTDTTAPDAPALTVTVNSTGKLVINGTAEAGSKVEITLPDGTTKATVTADKDGKYTYTATTVQPFGDTKVNATDASGNKSADTTVQYSTTTISLDTTPPTKPTIGLSTDATGHLVIRGKSEPYTKVTLTLPDGTTLQATTDKDGVYTATTTTTQPIGNVKATATDLSGNNSLSTIVKYSSTTTSSDTTPPDAPVITMKIESDKKMTISGTAEAGSSVEVTFADNTKKTVTADKDGHFSATSASEQANSGTYSAKATDASGNSSTSNSYTYEIKISDLVPTIKEDGTIIITGKGPINETMEVTFPDGTKKEVTSDGEGNFTVTSDEPQPGGEIIVDITDGTPVKAKIDGTTTSSDTTPPDVPTLAVTVNSTGKLVISGTAEAGSKVTLTLPNGTTATTIADIDGNYTYTATTIQPFGDVKAKATDISGNASGETTQTYSLANIYSATNTDGTIISNDTTAPDAPTVILSTQIDGKLAVKGKAEPFSSVTITFTDGTTKIVTADKSGNYSTLSNTQVPIGTIKVNATDLSGNRSVDGEASYQTGVTFTSDIKAPNAPTIILEVNAEGKLIIKGLSEAGSKVEITLPNGSKVSTIADIDGNYTYTSNTVQPIGIVKSIATDASGNASKEATKDYNTVSIKSDTNPNGGIVSSDTTAPDAPIVTMNISSDRKITFEGTSEKGSTVEVTFADGTKKTVVTDKDGNFSVTSDTAQPTPSGTNTIIAKDISGNLSQAVEKTYLISISELKADIDPDGKIIITGKAPAGETLEVTFPDGTKKEVTSDDEGNFTVTSEGPQPGGEVIVDMGDESPAKVIVDGTTTSSDETAPDAPTLVVSVNSTGKLVINGDAEAGSKVELTLPDGSKVTVNTGNDGKYSYTTTTLQPFGDVKAKATDISGNASEETTREYSVENIKSTTNTTGEIISSDTTAPDKPTATLTATKEGLLTLTGKAEALSFVTVKFTDGTLKVVQSDKDGVFSATSDTIQPIGYVKLSAKDASGNSSGETSLSYSFTNHISFDKTPPQTPTISTEVNSSGKLVISGTSEVGSTVTITLPDGTIKTTITGLNGTYSYTSTTVQPFGTAKANATDASGNKSGDATASYSSTTTSQDTTPPPAPIVLLYSTEEGLLSVKGKVEAYSTVTITFIDGTQKTVQANQNGAYEATSELPQPSGQVKAYTIDLSGNKSPDGVATYDINSLSYDTTPPQDPTVVLTTIEGKLKVSGEAEIGSRVTVTFPDGTTKDVVANSEGTYIAISENEQTEDGEVVVFSKDVTGNKSEEITENFVVGQIPTEELDTTSPTAVITLSDSALTVGETAVVTITFSEEVTGFELADLTAQNGTLSNLVKSTSNAKVYTATFTPTANSSDTTNVITLANTYTDLANNTGTTATSANYEVNTTSSSGGTGGTGTTDTTSPTAVITLSDSALTVGETAVVTITFSEEVTGFELADLTAQNGTLSNLVKSTSNAKVYTATFTPTANISDTTNVITLANTYTDIATNAGTTATSTNYTIDTTTSTGGTGTTAPAIPTISLYQDNGLLNNDGITNNGKISIGGTVGSTDYREYTVDGGTTWTKITSNYTYDFTLAEGSYSTNTVGVRAVDIAGNASAATYIAKDLVIDKTAPTSSIMTLDGMTLSFGSDVASISYMTSSGWSYSTLDSLATNTGYMKTLGISAIDMTNKTITFSKDQSAGAFKFKVKDLAGNESAELSSPVVADSSPLAQPSITSMKVLSNGTLVMRGTFDDYRKLVGNIWQYATLTITFTDGTTTNTTFDSYSDNSFYITSENPLPSGDITITATLGTRSTEPLTVALAIDPNDTITDPITLDITPPSSLTATHEEAGGKLKISGTTEKGAKVTITFPSGATKDVFAGTDGTYTVTSENAEPSGHYTVIASDLSGNKTPSLDKLYFSSTGDVIDVAITINAISADTGYSHSDFITKESAQTLSATLSRTLGTGENLMAKLDNGSWVDITSKVSGTSVSWDGITLALGTGQFELKVTNGTKDSIVTTQAYTYDATASSTTITDNSMVIVNDTGTSSTDSIITTGNFKITATLDNTLVDGDKVIITTDGGSTWSDITSYTNGTAISTANSGIAIGANVTQIEIRVEDAAGNTSDSITKAITVDGTKPAILGVVVSNDSPFMTVTGLEEGAWWRYALDLDGNGNFGYTYTTVTTGDKTPLPAEQDIYGFQLQQMDVAGNWSAWKVYTVEELTNGEFYNLWIESGLVTTTVSIDSLEYDTGSSSSDFYTSVQYGNTIHATLSAPLQDGEVVKFKVYNYNGNFTSYTGTVDGTDVSVANVTLYSSGSNTPTPYKIEAYVYNNNSSKSGVIEIQNYTIDITEPNIWILGETIAFGDTPDSSGDPYNWYNTSLLSASATQKVSATLSDELGSDYKLYGSLDDGTTWSDISSSVTNTTLLWENISLASSGSIQFKVEKLLNGKVGDVLSKSYIYSAGLSHDFSIESFSIDNDTGVSNSDLITQGTNHTITLTLDQALASGEKLQFSTDDGVTWLDKPNNSSSFTINGATFTGSQLFTQNATTNMKFRVVDSVGNEDILGTKTVTIDTTVPTVAITSAATSGIATPIISGTGESGTEVTITLGGATYKKIVSDGIWSINTTETPTSGTLNLNTSGNNTVSVFATDIAGNSSDPSTQTLYINTASVTPLSVRFYDNGWDIYDEITNDSRLVVDGLQSGATWQYSLNNGDTWSNSIANYYTTDGLPTNKTYEIGSILVRQTNDVGATGEVSSNTVAWTLDGTAPNSPSITSSNSTSDTTPLITGTADVGVKIELGVNGKTGVWTTFADNSGNWSIDTSITNNNSYNLYYNGDNTYTISVKAIDKAGNISIPQTQTISIDSTPPTPLSISLQTDSSRYNYTGGDTDKITYVNTINVAGLGEENTTWRYSLDGGTNWSNWLANTTTSFEMTDDTTYDIGRIKLEHKDALGNLSATSNSEKLVEQSTATFTINKTLLNANDQSISGTAQPGSIINIDFESNSYIIDLVVGENGNWTFSGLPSAGNGGWYITDLPIGEENVNFSVTNIAGNNNSYSETLIRDTAIPNSLTFSYVDSGFQDYTVNYNEYWLLTDTITNNTTATIGNMQSGYNIISDINDWRYSLNGGDTWSEWVILPTASSQTLATADIVLPEGIYASGDVVLEARDLAGNTMQSSFSGTFTVDTTAPQGITISNNPITLDTTPLISGTAEANTWVEVTFGGAVYLTKATSGGTWSIDTQTATPQSGTLSISDQANNTISVTATDAAGNISGAVTKDIFIDSTLTSGLSFDFSMSSTSDIYTNVNIVTVSGLKSDLTWQYSLNGGTDWSAFFNSTTTTFNMASDTTYNIGDILIRQKDSIGNIGQSIANSSKIIEDSTNPDIDFTSVNYSYARGEITDDGILTVYLACDASSLVNNIAPLNTDIKSLLDWSKFKFIATGYPDYFLPEDQIQSATISTDEEIQIVVKYSYIGEKGAYDNSLLNGTSTKIAYIYEAFLKDYAGNIDSNTSINTVTPIILDLNNDGVHTTSLENSQVVFDIDANGVNENTGWSDGVDGFLVLDVNYDGIINDGSELFGNGTTLADGSKAKDGYEALKQYDDNGDNFIDINDAIFNALQIWVDGNIDGQTGTDELYSLSQLGIASLDLVATDSSQTDNGNTLGLISSWTNTAGETKEMADVWFVANNNIKPEEVQPTTYVIGG